MKFLVDAHLPRRLADWLKSQGHDAAHTLDLPNGNATTDEEILALASVENRVVVTKDADFLHNFLLRGKPSKLLIVATGNISNKELLGLFSANFQAMGSLFQKFSVLEINRTSIVVRS